MKTSKLVRTLYKLDLKCSKNVQKPITCEANSVMERLQRTLSFHQSSRFRQIGFQGSGFENWRRLLFNSASSWPESRLKEKKNWFNHLGNFSFSFEWKVYNYKCYSKFDFILQVRSDRVNYFLEDPMAEV